MTASEPWAGSRWLQALTRRTVAGSAVILLASTLSTVWVAPLFDPDEGYYPATAAESVDAGSAWDPRFNGEPRWDKPILTYALIEGSFALFGRSVPAARLSSVVDGVVLILVVGFFVGRLAGPPVGRLASLILATTLGIQIFARVAHPEIGVVLMITTAELIAVMWLTTTHAASRLPLALAAGVALGLGCLFKGPVALVLPLLALVTTGGLMFGIRFPSKQGVRHLLACGLVVCAIALPWYAAMTWRHGLTFVEEAVWRQNVGRFAGAAYGHRSAPWFFVLPALIAMFPWTGFVPGALGRASRRSREPSEVLRLFMITAVVTSFVFYSASGSKLAHYALVFVPPLAILIALRWYGRRQSERRSSGLRATILVLCLLAVALAVSPLLINHMIGAREILSGLPRSDSQVTWLFERALWPTALLLGLGALGVSLSGESRSVPLLVVVGALVPTVLVLGARPLLESAYPWNRLGQEIRDTDVPVWLIGPRAPSLTFYAGRSIQRFSESEADSHELPACDAWIVADTQWLSRRMTRETDERRWQRVATFGGMTLARWHGRESVSDLHDP